MIVPFVDLARENVSLLPELETAFKRVARSGRVIYGEELEAFEREIAAWHGVRYAVGVGSGTDAVEIALRTAWGETDRPLTMTALTAVPTANAADAAGVTFSLVDVDPVTRNSTGADLSVHLYGLASDPSHCIVEDIAHSMGATIDGRMAGTLGECGALSFYCTKIMGALGDGGAIITDNADIAEAARKVRHYGYEDGPFGGEISLRGQNSRLCELQAAFLRVKMSHVKGWIERRRAVAARYNAEMAGRVRIPVEPAGTRHVYHVYVVESDERDRLKAALEARGIGCMVHYPRAIHQYERWKHLGEPGQFPVAEKLSRTVLSLPCFPDLTEREQDAVVRAVKDCT